MVLETNAVFEAAKAGGFNNPSENLYIYQLNVMYMYQLNVKEIQQRHVI